MARDQYSEQILGTASAIGVFYVQELLEINPELEHVKIGIIQITYGGTSIEMFMPECVNEKNGLVQEDDAVPCLRLLERIHGRHHAVCRQGADLLPG